MHILIIGGTNFIGPYICKNLLKLGHDLTLFHRNKIKSTGATSEKIKHIYGDRTDILKFKDDLPNIKPDIIIDMIAYREKDIKDLLDIFQSQDFKPKIILISSGDVYKAYDILWGKINSAPQQMPVKENSELRSLLFPHRDNAKDNLSFEYEYDKIPVEKSLIASNYHYIIFRLPMVYGPGDTSRIFDYLKRMDDKRDNIILSESESQWVFSRGYVENVAHAISLACKSPVTKGIFNVADINLTLYEWVNTIAQQASWSGEIIILPNNEMPNHLKQPLNFEQSLYYDTTLIEKELSYKPIVSIDEAMNNTIKWVRDNPPSQIDLQKFDYALEDVAISNHLMETLKISSNIYQEDL